MCSTPRPKTKVTGKSGIGGSLLSNLNAETRKTFAERANAAQERRDQMSMKSEQTNHQYDASMSLAKKIDNRTFTMSKKNLSYWLLSANIKEIIKMLFLGASRRN